MTNKSKISLSIVAVLFLALAGSAAAYSQSCVAPEAQAFREAVQTGNKQDPAIQAKLAALPALEQFEARICAMQKMSAEEVASAYAKKQAMTKGPDKIPGADQVPTVVLGIKEATDATGLGKDLMPGTNSWLGYVDGKLVSVTGTAYLKDPSKGVLFVMQDGKIVGSQRYAAPTSSGPLKIVSESNGVLTIQSVAGTYEAYDADTNLRQNVTTKGGTTYTFDTRTRTYK